MPTEAHEEKLEGMLKNSASHLGCYLGWGSYLMMLVTFSMQVETIDLFS